MLSIMLWSRSFLFGQSASKDMKGEGKLKRINEAGYKRSIVIDKKL